MKAQDPSFYLDVLIDLVVGDHAHICECGAGGRISVSPRFPLTLVEPNPEFYRLAVKKYPTATIHNVAIMDRNVDLVNLRLEAGQSHLTDIPDSPIFHKKKSMGEIVQVSATTFDKIDTGFDVVILDMEGAEWYALRHMTSRPAILMVETHSSITKYRNPFLSEIHQWAKENSYKMLYCGKSNTVWVL